MLRHMGIACLLVATWITVAGAAWTPPIGIPEPPFGISEQAPAAPNPWTSEAAGFYYVDPAGCSSSRTYGRPGASRCSIPNPAPAGSVVFLNGTLTSNQSFTSNGTAGNPVFVTAYNTANKPTVTQGLQVAGSYAVIENLNLNPGGAGASEGTHHISFRHIDATGNINTGGMAFGSWSYSGSQSVSYVVVYDVKIHDAGDVQASSDADKHCITVNGSVDHLWVLDSQLYRCGGDAIQLEAQQGRRDKIHHVYYGRNIAHDNRQTGGWVKHATDVVFSQNIGYNFRANSGGPGLCFGQQYGPERVWYLFNEGYACNIGIGVSGNDPPGDGQYTYIYGNVIHDTASQSPGDAYNAGCIVLRGSTNIYVANNTCSNTDGGIMIPPGTGGTVYIWNNIIRRAAGTAGATYDVYKEGANPALDMKNNIFSSSPRLTDGGGSSYSTADPQFISSADFHLSASSPAVDAGIVPQKILNDFQANYGMNIAYDKGGVSKPQGPAWDMGAYEYLGGVPGASAPSAPSGLRMN